MRNKFIIIFCLFTFIFIIISMQSSIFDTFKILAEKDIFLEFEVEPSLQYNLFVIDAYNSSVFGLKYSLEYSITSIYKKDEKTPYPSNIFVSPFKEGGLTTNSKEPVATFKPSESIIYVRVRGTSIKTEGTFGLALISIKNKKIPYKISKSIFNELHNEAIKKHNLEQYKINDGKALSFTYNVEKDKEHILTLVDSFNNELFGTYFTLDSIWFHVINENNEFYKGIYTNPVETGGITSLNNIYGAKFYTDSNIVKILVEPISAVYEGYFGIKLESEEKIIKPIKIEVVDPIRYETIIEDFFEEEILELDTLEIHEGSITINFNTEIGSIYYIYLADNFNQDIFNKTYTFKDLFFQIFDSNNNLIEDCYSSKLNYLDKTGGITILKMEPTASFIANSNIYYIKITSLSGIKEGTFGLHIIDNNKNIVNYEILNK